MCVCVCVCLFICVCVFVYVHVYNIMFECVYVRICGRLCVCVWVGGGGGGGGGETSLRMHSCTLLEEIETTDPTWLLYFYKVKHAGMPQGWDGTACNLTL